MTSHRMIEWLGRMGETGKRLALDLLFPPRCAVCDGDLPQTRVPPVCDRCREALEAPEWQFCRRCGLKTPQTSSSADDGRPEGCLRCRRTRSAVERVVPLGPYDGDLRQVVLRMKRVGAEGLIAAMGVLLHQRREDELEACRADVVVPIPMHWRRRLLRGIDGPAILAEILARELGLPRARALARTRSTRLQRDLLPGERFRNLRGAMRVRSGKRLEGRRILLVDDIMTTGATCAEAARVLRAAGAAAVAAAVVARAEPDRRKGLG